MELKAFVHSVMRHSVLVVGLLFQADLAAQRPIERKVAPLVLVDRVDLPEGATVIGAGALSRTGVLALSVVREPSLILLFQHGARAPRTLGRKGSGPGEYQLPLAPFWVGTDTVAFYDPRLRRVTFMDVVSGRTSSEHHPMMLPSARVLGWLGPNTLLVWQFESLEARGEEWDSSFVHVFKTADGQAERRGLVAYPKSPSMVRVLSPRVGRANLQPFLWTPFFGYDRSSATLFAAHSEPSSRDGGVQVSLLTYGLDGAQRQRARMNITARRIGAQDRKRVTDSLRRTMGLDSPGMSSLREQLSRQLYLPEYEPPLRGMLVDERGGMWLWVREEGRTNDLICGWRLGAGHATCAELPPGAVPIAAMSSGRVITVQYDADGIPSVWRHQLAGYS